MKHALLFVLCIALTCLHAIQGANVHTSNLNSFAPGMASSKFLFDGPVQGPLTLQLSIPIQHYRIENLRCMLEVQIGDAADVSSRTYDVDVKIVVPDTRPYWSDIAGQVTTTQTLDLGQCEFICTFFLSGNHFMTNGQATFRALSSGKSTTVLGPVNIAQFFGFAETATTVLARPDSLEPSVFKLTLTNSGADGRMMTVFNSNPVHGTSTAAVQFSPVGATSNCDVIWDKSTAPNGATATVTSDGTGVIFAVEFPLKPTHDITFVCHGIKGVTSVEERFRPSLLTYSAGSSRIFSIPEYSDKFSSEMFLSSIGL